MAVYQKMDHDITFEVEIALLLVKGEESKVFINPAEGMWYGSVHQNKQGQTVKTTNLTKPGQDYVNHMMIVTAYRVSQDSLSSVGHKTTAMQQFRSLSKQY